MDTFRLMLMISLGITGLNAAHGQLTPCHEKGWYQVGPFCAVYVNRMLPFLEAYKECRAICHDCNLISVQDYQTNEDLTALTLNRNVWIGAFKMNHLVYMWVDGSVWGYGNWAPSQPDGNGNCVQFNYQHPGKWDDLECRYPRGYVCAFPNGV